MLNKVRLDRREILIQNEYNFAKHRHRVLAQRQGKSAVFLGVGQAGGGCGKTGLFKGTSKDRWTYLNSIKHQRDCPIGPPLYIMRPQRR